MDLWIPRESYVRVTVGTVGTNDHVDLWISRESYVRVMICRNSYVTFTLKPLLAPCVQNIHEAGLQGESYVRVTTTRNSYVTFTGNLR
jgi:hypothetical protein